MNSYRLTEAAKADLIEIWRFIARDNPDAADRFLDLLLEKITRLAERPSLGRLRTELGENLRSLPVGNYIIFYKPLKKNIEVARVVHAARRYERLFTNQDTEEEE